MALAFLGVIVGVVAIYFLWPKDECKAKSKEDKKCCSKEKKVPSPTLSDLEKTQTSVRSQKVKQFSGTLETNNDRISKLQETESVSLVPKVIPNLSSQKPIAAAAESSVLDYKQESNNISSSEQHLPPRNVEISRINYESDAPTARELFSSHENLPRTANDISQTPKKTKIPTLLQVDVSPLKIQKKSEVEGDSTRTAKIFEDKNNNTSMAKMSPATKKVETPTKQSQKSENNNVNPAKITKSPEQKEAKDEHKKSSLAKPPPTVPAAAAPTTPSKKTDVEVKAPASATTSKNSSVEGKKGSENEKSGRKDKKDKSGRQDKKEKKSKKEKSSTSSDRKKDKKNKKSPSKQPKSGDGV